MLGICAEPRKTTERSLMRLATFSMSAWEGDAGVIAPFRTTKIGPAVRLPQSRLLASSSDTAIVNAASSTARRSRCATSSVSDALNG
ncbi:hypothetical protein D9M70_509320 [compost metagenome]